MPWFFLFLTRHLNDEGSVTFYQTSFSIKMCQLYAQKKSIVYILHPLLKCKSCKFIVLINENFLEGFHHLCKIWGGLETEKKAFFFKNQEANLFSIATSFSFFYHIVLRPHGTPFFKKQLKTLSEVSQVREREYFGFMTYFLACNNMGIYYI